MKDLTELVWQSLISLAILLVFVWLTKREWKYLVIISVTLMANILLAVIAYWFFDIRLHPYSLAGITVSLGLIIDASIVMTDHYSYYRNRKSALAITAALLTTVGALIVIFFMPEQVKHDLKDFTWVVIINLTLALLVAIFFVPALVDSLLASISTVTKKLSKGISCTPTMLLPASKIGIRSDATSLPSAFISVRIICW